MKWWGSSCLCRCEMRRSVGATGVLSAQDAQLCCDHAGHKHLLAFFWRGVFVLELAIKSCTTWPLTNRSFKLGFAINDSPHRDKHPRTPGQRLSCGRTLRAQAVGQNHPGQSGFPKQTVCVTRKPRRTGVRANRSQAIFATLSEWSHSGRGTALPRIAVMASGLGRR